MAKLRLPREEVGRAIAERVKVGQGVVAKAEIADNSGRYQDWLDLLELWRNETNAELLSLYEESEIAGEFRAVTSTADHSSPRFEFPHAKRALDMGIFWLRQLSDGLSLAIGESDDATALDSLHPDIYSSCRKLFESGDYAEAVEKSFKLVRDRLRALTGHETGSEAFGKGNLYIDGAVASHVDDDFQAGVRFLTMAIDRFRNEKAHTADGNIRDPIRAYEYLRLSSLAMHLLAGGRIP